MAAVKKIAEAIKSIPGKKEILRESLEVLRSYSSLATFNLEWKDLDDHLSDIEKSIDGRFKALEAKEEKQFLLGKSNNTSNTNKNDNLAILTEGEGEVSPRPELKSVCVRMDAKGLAAVMEEMRVKDMDALRKELASALRFAPDPAQLVLDAVSFHSNPPDSELGKGACNFSALNRRNCANLLEALPLVAPEIGPAVRKKALMRAAEWKAKISLEKGGDHFLEMIALLQLIASYNIVANFDREDILELFSTIARRKSALGLVKSLGLIDNFPELFQKLSSKGRQLDAVKIIYAYDMAEKFPPVPILEAFVKESKKITEEIQERGKNSRGSQNKAISNEVGALKSVVKFIEDYKLENENQCQDLWRCCQDVEKRISQLLQQKSNKKQDPPGASVSILKNQKQQQQLQQSNKKRDPPCASVSISEQQQQQQQHRQSNKRPRQLATTAVHAMPANPYPSLIQNHPQHGLAGHASYMAGPYGLIASGSVYNQLSPSLSGTAIGHSGTCSPPRPYLYSSDAFAGTSGLYDRPVTYSGYPPSGLPPSYGSLLYP